MVDFDNSPLAIDRHHFEKHLDSLSWKPDIWWDEDYYELVFEWIDEESGRHAVVSLSGTDGRYGYCYKINGTFVSGKQFDPLVTEFPQDLRNYLL